MLTHWAIFKKLALISPTDIKAPRSEQELLNRAANVAGKSLQQIANELGIEIPENQLRAKGWVGEILENYLGATAASRPEPDFQHIGVELKTLPIDDNSRPRESTYVCTVPLEGRIGEKWEDSVVRIKLDRVLWVPVEASPAIPLRRRRIGSAFLWSPNEHQEADLCRDWHEHMEKINAGEVSTINARQGKYLQVRPKASDSRALTRTTSEEGGIALTLPRGFYLRSTFTHALLLEEL